MPPPRKGETATFIQRGFRTETAGGARVRPGRPLEFVHPVVRAAVYADIPAAARALGHRRAGRLLALEQAPPERVAAHLLASEPEADTWTVDTLRRAAQQALGRGAPESAILYLQRALWFAIALARTTATFPTVVAFMMATVLVVVEMAMVVVMAAASVVEVRAFIHHCALSFSAWPE